MSLALKAFRLRQSKQTGLIHYCYDNPEHHFELIPIYENFLFALALLRSRISDDVLEGRALLEKLLHLQQNGNFPVYFHNFPECPDRNQAMKILPILHFAQTSAGPLKEKISAAIEQCVAFGLNHDLPKGSMLKLKAYLKEFAIFDELPTILPEYRDYLIALQMADLPAEIEQHYLELISKVWDAHLLTYIGHQKQDRGEPQITHYDLYMSEYFDRELPHLTPNQPIAMHTALVYPFKTHKAITEEPSSFRLVEPYTLLWRDTVLHSFIYIPEELACYCNLHPDHRIFINGETATTFQLDDTIEIRSKKLTITLKFKLLEGEGIFMGHISRANRPSQVANKNADRFTAFDWKISLRPVTQSDHARIGIFLTPEIIKAPFEEKHSYLGREFSEDSLTL
jgi:hypothetical protein